MDLLERAKQKLADQKTEVKKPKKSVVKKKFTTEKKPKINEVFLKQVDFSNLADSSDFKRLIYLAITGKSFRGSNIKLEKELKQKLKGDK